MADLKPPGSGDSLLEPGERPTLKTISRATGLAVATVSRALHDAPDIGADTKRRVAEIARQIGYRPNRAGVRLRTGKTNVISLVLATDHDMMNHTARLISSIVAELRGTAYHMIVTPYFPGEDPMVPVRYLVENGAADGIIMNQTEPEDARIAYLMAQDIPFATHGRSNWRDRHAWFDFDNFRFGELGTEILSTRGRKNVALILPPIHHNYALDIRDGTLAAAQARQMSIEIVQGATGDGAGTAIESATLKHFSQYPDTDAIICSSTTAAMAAATAAEALGKVIGRDVDIFAKEAVPFLRRFRSGILTVHEDVTTCGRFLARAVIERINNPDAPPMQALDIPEFSKEDLS